MVGIDCTVLFQCLQVSYTRGNSMKLIEHHVASRDGHFTLVTAFQLIVTHIYDFIFTRKLIE